IVLTTSTRTGEHIKAAPAAWSATARHCAGSVSDHAEGGFYFPDISCKYDAFHSQLSASFNVGPEVIDKKRFLRFQRICLKKITIDLRIGFRHFQRSGKYDPTEHFEYATAFRPFREISRRIG